MIVSIGAVAEEVVPAVLQVDTAAAERNAE